MSRLFWVGAGAGGVAWLMWRMKEREKLVALMRRDPLLLTLVNQDMVRWTFEERAAQLLPLASATTADQAFAQVQNELPVLPHTVAQQWGEKIEQQTGVDVSPALEKLSKWVPGLGYAEEDEPTWGAWLANL